MDEVKLSDELWYGLVEAEERILRVEALYGDQPQDLDRWRNQMALAQANLTCWRARVQAEYIRGAWPTNFNSRTSEGKSQSLRGIW